jgi:hypothetical protein
MLYCHRGDDGMMYEDIFFYMHAMDDPFAMRDGCRWGWTGKRNVNGCVVSSDTTADYFRQIVNIVVFARNRGLTLSGNSFTNFTVIGISLPSSLSYILSRGISS